MSETARLSMTRFLSTMFVLLVSSSNAVEFYHRVDGNCSDLPRLEKYDYLKIATGEWYSQYASFGQEGDRCSSGHAVARGTKLYLDFVLFDTTKNHYIKFPDDLTYHPDQPGLYTSDAGAVARMVATDLLSYLYYVQCEEKDGRNNVMAILATRDREVGKEAQQVYEDISSKLADMKLLPKMHQINQTHCPPMYDVGFEIPT